MEETEVTIIVSNVVRKEIESFLTEFFSYDKSEINPIYISSDLITAYDSDKSFSFFRPNWRLKTNFDQNKGGDILAKISFSEYPKGLIIKFKFNEDYKADINHPINAIKMKLKAVGYIVIDDELEKQTSQPDGEKEIYIPQKKAALDRWKKAYSHYSKELQKYKSEKKNHPGFTSKPGISELRKIINENDIFPNMPTDRTLQRILKAGKAGKLK